MVGEIPDEAARWRRRHNYYLNCLRDADRNIALVLAELEASGLADRTIIVLTADHGDMDGAHKLHAKGAVAYREQNNVPLVVVHPSHPGGRQCRAVTSHVDLAPTLLALTGIGEARAKAIGKDLPGKDFSGCWPRRTGPAKRPCATGRSFATTCWPTWTATSSTRPSNT
jgi:arylsulfatase A-like enzyme